MSAVTLTDKWVLTRKRHICVWCGEIIEAKTRVKYITGVYDDRFFNHYWHTECDSAFYREDIDSDEGFDPHDHDRGRTYGEMEEERIKLQLQQSLLLQDERTIRSLVSAQTLLFGEPE